MSSPEVQNLRIPREICLETLAEILVRNGFAHADAAELAQTFTENSLDGIYTHGLNRFPRFVDLVRRGHVDPSAVSECTLAAGALEQWNGHLGAGILNARGATDRAMELAESFGMGCVGLANTNHWMRGGTYGWRAAERGFVFIGWTNTIANLPAWGATDCRLGNNPLVLAVPHEPGAVVLDMAQSQFSYGAMELAAGRRERLSVPGGYDAAGGMTDDPQAILDSQRPVPVGYWKGAGLSLLLDLLATLLSGGRSTADITRQGLEYGVSQVFIAIDLDKLGDRPALLNTIQSIIDDLHQSVPAVPEGVIRYPGEAVLARRADNESRGIPVDPSLWHTLRAL